jgi:hypothetical protein
LCNRPQDTSIVANGLGLITAAVGSSNAPLQIQRPVERLRLVATLLAAALALIHLGMFVLMYELMGQQSDLVNNLGLIGKCYHP